MLWICDKVFDADFQNGIYISSKYGNINKGDFKEIVKDDKNWEISFCFNEQFCYLLIKRKSCLVNDDGHESANLYIRHKVMYLNTHQISKVFIQVVRLMPNYSCRTKFTGLNQV